MKNVMQSRSVTIAELKAGTVPNWVTKSGDICTFTNHISGFILPTGGTAGVISAKLDRDEPYRLIPITVNDIITPLPSITKIDVSVATTAGDTTILFGETV